MDRFENPFRPGAGAPPPALMGRSALIEAFDVEMQRTALGRPSRGLVAVGLRGVGKTVLLNRFVEIAQQIDAGICFIEAPEGDDLLRELCLVLRRELFRLERARPSARITRALSVVKSLSLTIPGGLSVGIDIDVPRGLADSGDLAFDLTETLVAVGDAFRDQQRGLLLSVDEMQSVPTGQMAALLAAYHRCVQRSLPVLLVGAGLPGLLGLLGDSKSYAERMFIVNSIGPLDSMDAAAVIRKPLTSRNLEITESALNQVIEEAGRYPYFLQVWGYHLWNAARRSPFTDGLVSRIAGEVRTALDRDFFSIRLDRVTPRERDYLAAMARLGPGPHDSGVVAEAAGMTVQVAGPKRTALIRKGMVFSPRHGQTAFTVPMFDDFLRRALPVDSGGAPDVS